MSMILGYTLSLPDSDVVFYASAPSSLFCESCETVLVKTYLPLENLLLCRLARSHDLFFTDDSKVLISERAALFFRREFSESAVVTRVKAKTPLFLLESRKIVNLDPIKRGVEFVDLCTKCGGYRGAYGATPCFFKMPVPLPHGLYRSDLEFGTGKYKSPLLIFGADDAAIFKKFKPHGGGGIVLNPINLESS